MNLYVLLNFYNEPDEMLNEMITSLRPLRPRCIVCCDGTYENFPADDPVSPESNYLTIWSAAANIGATVHRDPRPTKKWSGDEVSKRQRLLELMLEIAGVDDWFLVVDSDYLLKRADGVREKLAATKFDAAHVSFYEGLHPDGTPGSYDARLLMRCTPGMYMDGNHYTYRLPDGRHHHILGRDSTIPALDLTQEMLVYHRVHERDEERRRAQTRYYEARDEGKLER